MDDRTFKMLLLLLASGLVIIFFYTSWQSRLKLKQIRAFPSVLQAAGLQLFSNNRLHESYRFLQEFKNNLFVEKTLYAATDERGDTDITVFAYSETRAGRRSYHILALTATLPYLASSVCIFTRNTRFGPPTPSNHSVFKTNVFSVDKFYRITAASKTDFHSLITPQIQQFLMQNTDISQIEIAQNTLALFTSDNRFFQLTTINGIPSPEIFNLRLKQLRQLHQILLSKSYS